MEIIITLVVVGALIYIFVQTRRQSKDEEEQDKDVDRFSNKKNEMSIKNVGAGGVLHLTNFGPEMLDMDVTIKNRHLYQQGNYQWISLEGESSHGKVSITVEDDDELEISAVLKELKLRDLGVSKKDLKKIDDDEEGGFTFDGEKYYYEDSDEAQYLKDGLSSNAEEVYYWEFENDSGNKFISIEEYDGDYEVSLLIPIKERHISIFSTK